jgi:hypothetical protein
MTAGVDHRYLLQVQSMRLDALVLVNGMTAFEAWDPMGRLVEYAITPWLVEGPNRIEVRLAALPHDPDAEAPLFGLSLHRVAVPGGVWSGSAFTGYSYTENESALVEHDLRIVFAHRFRIASKPEKWDFERAKPFSREDLPALEEALRGLHDALSSRDLKRFKAMLAMKTTEVALGLDLPRAHVEAELDGALVRLMSEPDWRMDPLELHALKYEPGHDGRLVAVRAPGGRPPLVGRARGVPFALTPTLSRIGEAWRVVR